MCGEPDKCTCDPGWRGSDCADSALQPVAKDILRVGPRACSCPVALGLCVTSCTHTVPMSSHSGTQAMPGGAVNTCPPEIKASRLIVHVVADSQSVYFDKGEFGSVLVNQGTPDKSWKHMKV